MVYNTQEDAWHLFYTLHSTKLMWPPLTVGYEMQICEEICHPKLQHNMWHDEMLHISTCNLHRNYIFHILTWCPDSRPLSFIYLGKISFTILQISSKSATFRSLHTHYSVAVKLNCRPGHGSSWAYHTSRKAEHCFFFVILYWLIFLNCNCNASINGARYIPYNKA